MTKLDQERASAKIDLVAQRNHWQLKSDPSLQFVTPQLKIALEIFEAKRDGRAMPSRNDLSMRDLKPVLPNLAFLEIVRDGLRVRLKAKLVGTELDSFIGGPMTGRYLDEAVPTPFAEKWQTLWMPAIDERAPTRTLGRVEFADKRYYINETLHAPLATDGETPDALMLVSYFHSAYRNEADPESLAQRLMHEIGERSS